MGGLRDRGAIDPDRPQRTVLFLDCDIHVEELSHDLDVGQSVPCRPKRRLGVELFEP
jgi:hypothetical protein